MGELEAFYARRRNVTVIISLASILQAILFGSSVLIEGLLTTFDEPGRTYAFHGLLVKGRCGHTGVGTPGGTPEHWGYTKNTWVYTPRSLNIVLGL